MAVAALVVLSAVAPGALELGSAPSAAAAITTTVSLPAVADTYVVQSQPTTVKGTLPSMYATTAENRAFVRFNTVGAVPAGQKIVGAALRVYVRNIAVTGAGFELHRAPNSWAESTLTAANRPAHDATPISAAVAVPAELVWQTVPLTNLGAVSTTAATSFELLHKVPYSLLQLGTREGTLAPRLQLTLAPVEQVQTPGTRPFDLPARTTLAASPRLAFAHYFPPYPLSLDNKAPSLDYYTTAYLNPNGESGKHAAYGGLLRDRPIGRPVLSTRSWAATDFETEVRQARAAGLDGFAVDILNVRGVYFTRVIELLQAAHRVDPTFKIMLQPDMTTVDDETSESLAVAMTQLAAYPAAFKLADGRLVISPFKAENKTAAWWTTWLSTMRNSKRVPVAFVPLFLNWQANASAFAPISYGFSHWGTSNPDAAARTDDQAVAAHAMGKLWMAPPRIQDERPNQGVYDEAGATETLRVGWEGVISGKAEWVMIPTWNDYSEGAAIAPSAHHGWAFLDIASYYLSRWKTGTAPPIVRDGLYLTHRTQNVAAVQSFPQTKLMRLRTGPTVARNSVEALTFLVAPARVTVKVGVNTYAYDAPAGQSVRTFPLAVGTVSGSVSRNAVVTTKVTSPHVVVTRPYVQDLQYSAVSSLRP